MNRFLLTMLLACQPLVAVTQESARDDPASKLFRELRAQPDALSRYRLLENARRDADDPQMISFIRQMQANDLAEMTRYRQAETGVQGTRLNRVRLQPEGQTRNAAEFIAKASTGRRVVMLNEAHTIARTRILTLQLLKPLRDAGFTHLALETLAETDDEIRARGYPVATTGFYTNEPLFAEMVRQAMALGYVLLPYEYTGSDDSQQARETGQADNLATVLSANPNARILVHAGHGHILKDSWQFVAGAKTMADELHRLTGIQPLAIEQTALIDYPDNRSTHPAYAAGQTLWRTQHGGQDPPSPFVVVTERGSAWSLRSTSFDISVFAAPWTDDQHWRELDGLRPRRDIADNPCTTYPCLIEARYMAESDAAVPADRQLLDEAASVQLWLRDGCYRISHLPKDTGANGRPRQVCFGVEAGEASVNPLQ